MLSFDSLLTDKLLINAATDFQFFHKLNWGHRLIERVLQRQNRQGSFEM